MTEFVVAVSLTHVNATKTRRYDDDGIVQPSRRHVTVQYLDSFSLKDAVELAETINNCSAVDRSARVVLRVLDIKDKPTYVRVDSILDAANSINNYS